MHHCMNPPYLQHNSDSRPQLNAMSERDSEGEDDDAEEQFRLQIIHLFRFRVMDFHRFHRLERSVLRDAIQLLVALRQYFDSHFIHVVVVIDGESVFAIQSVGSHCCFSRGTGLRVWR